MAKSNRTAPLTEPALVAPADRAGLIAARLTELHGALRVALLAGADTASIRADIALTETEAADIARQLAEQEADRVETELLAQDAVADALAQPIMARLRGEFIDGDTEFRENHMLASTLDRHEPEIFAAAGRVAAAEAALADSRAGLEKAASALAGVNQRIADLDAARAGIIARRAAGQLQAGDGAELALLAADREGLIVEQSKATAEFHARTGPNQAAVSALKLAQAGLATAEQAGRREALIGRLTALDSALLSDIAALRVVSLPGRPLPWGASAHLRTELRNIAVARHEV